MNDLFLRTCRGEVTERRPVWIMRQAGRFLPEYRAVRAKVDFLTLCKTPDLAAEVTLQPVDVLDVDAAILFADILLPLEAMGAELVFAAGDGPTFPHPVRTREAAAALTPLGDDAAGERLGYVYEALRRVRRALDGRVPVIGFGGTPWTLAAYLVEGGGSKQFAHLLGWSWSDPEGLALLLDRLADTSLAYLRGQLAAGAQAIQLFDTWGGLLDPERYERIALPPLLKVIRGLRGAAEAAPPATAPGGALPIPSPSTPLIYYLHGGSHLLGSLAKLPVDVLSVDWRLPLGTVRRALAADGAKPPGVLQGNLDPAALLAPIPEIERRVAGLIREGTPQQPTDGGAGQGHVVNLGHGILPTTPVENARAFVEAAKRLSAAGALD
jgi:uroporphyrinogen decarboxylase